MTLNWTELLKIAQGFDKDAAASEAKKNALVKKYQLTQDDVEFAANTDPSPNGEYTEWLCREMNRGNLSKSDQMWSGDEFTYSILTTFTKLKQSPDFQEAVKEGIYSNDIMKFNYTQLNFLVSNAQRLISKNQRMKTMLEGSRLWSGEFEGHKIEVFMFGVGEGEAYAYISGGPSLSRDLNPTPHTSWCTTQENTATDYLEDGDAYIIRVDGRNYCNINEASEQCMDAANRSMVNGSRVIKDPIVQFTLETAKIPLEYFKTNDDNICHQCHKDGGVMEDTRYGYEGQPLCMKCFTIDWVAEIKRYIMDLYNANEDAFKEEPTTNNMRQWVQYLWDIDGKEHERNFWNPEDIKQPLELVGVYSEAIYTGPVTTE